LCTSIFSAAFARHEPTRLLKPRALFLFVAVGVKVCVMMLVWSGPAASTCWLGFNCDSQRSFEFLGECLNGPQLLQFNQDHKKGFSMPKPFYPSNCRYRFVTNPQPEVITPIDVFPNIYRTTCEGSNNCIESDVRWKFSASLLCLTVLSMIGSVIVGWVFRRKR